MKKIFKVLVSLFLLLSFLPSCATNRLVEKKIEKEIQSETIVNQEDLAEKSRKYILNSETITELQKKSLLSLQDKSMSESKDLNEKLNKSKLVLMKIILNPKVDEKEVYALRKKIKQLNKKRMDLDYKLFTDARKIIDPLKEVRDREFLYNSYMMRSSYYW